MDFNLKIYNIIIITSNKFKRFHESKKILLYFSKKSLFLIITKKVEPVSTFYNFIYFKNEINFLL